MAKAICVYCASSPHVAKEYFDEARALGAAIGSRGHTLVYGGGGFGLMGELARAALGVGGRVVGVIPQALVERELALSVVSEQVVTEDMHRRKETMALRADAFIALPGGFGTLEEIIEVIAHRQLGIHSKPCVLVNVGGYYSSLIEFFERFYREGFTDESHRGVYSVANSALEALEAVEKAW